MATEHGERDDARALPTEAPDESVFAETLQSGASRVAERVGPWNSQCERFAQSIILAARLGGGGNITFKFGGMVAEVEVKHTKSEEPELVQRTRDMRLEAVAKQVGKIQAVKEAAEQKAAAKKAKRQRQRERKKAAKQQEAAQQPAVEAGAELLAPAGDAALCAGEHMETGGGLFQMGAMAQANSSHAHGAPSGTGASFPFSAPVGRYEFGRGG